MSRLVLLLPEWQRCIASEPVANGTLAQWVARGDRLAALGAGTTDALKAHFEWPATSFPLAAFSRQFDVGDAQGSAWLRADPSHIRADMVTARMLASGNLGLSAEECAGVARALKPVFGDAGFEFDTPRCDRWYLRAPVDARLPQCADPDQVMGDDLKLHLPEGADGRRWRHLFNEVQVVLHHHPVNADRARRGAVSVNALWFWGAGALPRSVRSRLHALYSNRPELRALASQAGVESQALDGDGREQALKVADAEHTVLLDLVTVRDRSLEEDWLAPCEQALRGGPVDEIQLQFAGGDRLCVRRSHRWRFWRRIRGLTG
jgi:hypothetical protein